MKIFCLMQGVFSRSQILDLMHSIISNLKMTKLYHSKDKIMTVTCVGIGEHLFTKNVTPSIAIEKDRSCLEDRWVFSYAVVDQRNATTWMTEGIIVSCGTRHRLL